MSKASELEAARLAAERLDARGKAIEELIEPADSSWPVPADVLNGLAGQLLAEATYISEQRKSGWKSRSDAHTAAGRILEQWARDLAAYLERDEPPMRPPLETIKSPDKHADLDPADGPISAQITSGLLSQTSAPKYTAEPQCRAEYPHKPGDRIMRCGKVAGHTMTPGDEPHAEWIENDPNDPEGPIAGGDWGPEWTLPTSVPDWPDGAITPDAATRVRLATEAGKGVDDKLDAAFGPVDKPAPVHITAAPANYALCDATTGMRGYVGTATCPDCIARYDAYDEAADKALALRPTEPENAVTIPQFSEPGPPPARHAQQRMTFEAVRQHGLARARGADHRSYSQVQAFSECGIRYALSDLDVTPAWWNVGGTALHYACEWVNRQCYEYDIEAPGTDRIGPVPTDHAIETLWTNCLNRSISETIAEHPTAGPDTWRAAKKGAEGYDWWRVHGLDMVRRWIARLTRLYEQGWSIATVDGKPAIELDCPMWIDRSALDAFGNPSLIKVENILDLAMVRGDTFLIVDFKSGASDPTSTYQLGQYGHALNHALGGDGYFALNACILGTYWLARTDMLAPVDVTKTDTATDIRELHPWAEIEYLITTMHAAESQGLYLPNKSKSDRFGCGSCGVAGFCPVGPR